MEFDLRTYGRLILKWWWLLIVGAIVPVVISYHFVSQRQELYQAKVILMVGTTLQSTNPDQGEISLAERLARGYAEIVRYRPVTNQVILKLELTQSPEQLAEQITAFVRPEANLLEIHVTDVNPRAAALIANTLADELIQQSPASQIREEQQRFVEQQMSRLKTKIEQVEAQIEEQTAELINLTSATEIQSVQANLESLETVVSRYRSEYALYMQSYVGESVNQLTIVEPAVEPPYPMGGQKTLILGVAGVSGLGLVFAGILLMNYMDNTLKWDKGQASLHGLGALDLPVLGVLGRLPVDSTALIAERSFDAKALRTCRTNLLLTRSRHPYKTLLIAGPEQDNSLIVTHLGASLASAGERVILVDANLRSPSLHEHLDQPNLFGLTDLLHAPPLHKEGEPLAGLRKIDIELQTSSLSPGSLWLLPAGRIPLDPAPLLMSDACTALITHLREQADIILFDAPPMLDMPDVSILATKLDATLLTVMHGATTRQELERAVHTFEQKESGTLLGVIFSHVSLPTYVRRYETVSSFTPLAHLLQRLPFVPDQVKLPTDAPERWVPLAEAARRLGISAATARRWSKAGRLPTIRHSSPRWPFRYIRQGDLEAIIAQEIQNQRGQSIRLPPETPEVPLKAQARPGDQRDGAAQLSHDETWANFDAPHSASLDAEHTACQRTQDPEPVQVLEETGEKQ